MQPSYFLNFYPFRSPPPPPLGLSAALLQFSSVWQFPRLFSISPACFHPCCNVTSARKCIFASAPLAARGSPQFHKSFLFHSIFQVNLHSRRNRLHFNGDDTFFYHFPLIGNYFREESSVDVRFLCDFKYWLLEFRVKIIKLMLIKIAVKIRSYSCLIAAASITYQSISTQINLKIKLSKPYYL